MALDFIRRTVGNIDAATIGLPAGNARGVMLVGVSDAAVMLFLVLVFDGIRGRIAAHPERFDKRFALVVGLEALEDAPLFVGDDVGDVFVQPLAVRGQQLLAELLLTLLNFFGAERLGDGLALLGGLFGIIALLRGCEKAHRERQGNAGNRET